MQRHSVIGGEGSGFQGFPRAGRQEEGIEGSGAKEDQEASVITMGWRT